MLSSTAFAQRSLRYWETGLFVGTANYSGELTQSGDFGTMINENAVPGRNLYQAELYAKV